MAVFFYDLLRTTRRGRVIVLRTAYALALLVALGGVFVRWFPGRLNPSEIFAPGEPLRGSQLEAFGEQFTAACLLVQFAAALILTPAYAGGAIAEERQRRTLDSLRVTHLTATQLVLGKLGSRLAHLFGVLLTGVPVLFLTPLWGGTSYGLIAIVFVLTALTVASVGALSLYCSARARTPRAAVAATFLIMGLVGGLTWCVPIIQLANPLFVLAHIFAVSGGMAPVTEWFVLVAVYGIWHTALFVLFTILAIRVVHGTREPEQGAAWSQAYAAAVARRAAAKAGVARPVPGSQARPKPPPLVSPWGTERGRRPGSLIRVFPLPPIGRYPLLWKELYFAGGSSAGELARVAGAALVGIALSAALTYAVAVIGNLSVRGDLTSEVNPLARGLTSALCTTIGIGTVLRAAAAIGREREQRTLDALLTLPGGRPDVLRAKWAGSIIRGRWLMLGLVALWAVSVFAGAVHPLGVFLLLIAGLTHLTAFTSLGLYVSVRTRGTGRAMLLALATLLILWLVPLIVSSYWLGAATAAARSHGWLTAWLEDGLVPPLTWWHLGFHARDLYAQPSGERVAGIALGLATYALAAWLLWQATLRRFARGE